MRGFSDAYGSWNTICMRRRMARSSRPATDSMARPSKRIVPDVGSRRRSTRRPVVDLPHPDSPTRPSVSRRSTEKVTSSTACTTPPSRSPKYDRRAGKCLTRPVDLEQARVGHAGLSWRDAAASSGSSRGTEAGGSMLGRRVVDGLERRVARRGSGPARTDSAGASAHASGSRSRLGGVPGIVASGTRRSDSSRGSDPSRPSVYGWRGPVEDVVERSPPPRCAPRTSPRRGRPCPRRSRGRG